MSWLLAFVLTLAIEVPVYTFGLRHRVRPARGAAVALGVNAVTHPVLWFGLSALQRTGASYWLVTLSAEVAVVLIEAALVIVAVRPGAMLAVRVSAIANGLSFGLGLLGSALVTWVAR